MTPSHTSVMPKPETARIGFKVSAPRRQTGVALFMPAANSPVRRLERSRGRASWASQSPFICASKPCITVTRSVSIRSRHSSGSKVAVRIWRAPKSGDIKAPSE